MEIEITGEAEEVLKERLASGMYTTAKQIVREGILLLKHRDSLMGDSKELAWLRGEIEKTNDDSERIVLKTDEEVREFFADIKVRGRRRLEEKQRLRHEAIERLEAKYK
jgi:hypothetical protein